MQPLPDLPKARASSEDTKAILLMVCGYVGWNGLSIMSNIQ